MVISLLPVSAMSVGLATNIAIQLLDLVVSQQFFGAGSTVPHDHSHLGFAQHV
jgi:hypothetical protein